MATALRCPRCHAGVQAHWTRCPACGFEPPAERSRPGDPARAAADEGPPAVEPLLTAPVDDERPLADLPRNVHDPEADDRGPHPVVVVVLASVAAVLIGLIVVGVVLEADDGGSGAALGPVSLGQTAEDRSATELDDGWWRLDLDDGALAVDLPGPLLRTRDELVVADEITPVPAAMWVGGSGTEEVYGVVVAEPQGSWGRSSEELLEAVTVTVAGQPVDGDGVRTEVAGRPALRRFAGGGGRTTVTTAVAADDTIVILVVRSDPAGLEDVLGRMESTLQLG